MTLSVTKKRYQVVILLFCWKKYPNVPKFNDKLDAELSFQSKKKGYFLTPYKQELVMSYPSILAAKIGHWLKLMLYLTVLWTSHIFFPPFYLQKNTSLPMQQQIKYLHTSELQELMGSGNLARSFRDISNTVKVCKVEGVTRSWLWFLYLIFLFWIFS